MEEKLFINMRYVNGIKTSVPMYVNHNGVIKRYIPSPFAKKDALKSGIWCLLDDLPSEMRTSLEDMAISQEDLLKYFKTSTATKKGLPSTYASNENVKLHITGNTLLLPVVENFLPYDGTSAYTVTQKNGKPHLDEILVCWDCHWSELYTGQTKYGNNVFCLAQDLPKEAQEKYADSFITLSDALNYLSQNEPEDHKTL